MKFVIIGFLVVFHFSLSSQETEWLTYFELSGGMKTPTYEQTINYCLQLEEFSPLISYTTIGKSAQGRDIPLLIVDGDGNFDPGNKDRNEKVLVLIQACIHSGESDGKDAGLMLIRDIMIHNKYPGLLDNITLLFIPIYNVDGHERSGPYSRINQNGPEEMGWRANAQNLNLNRDYLKADAPETNAWLQLFNAWSPDFFIDCHTTDGADYQYVLTYEMEIHGNMDKGLTQWQKNSFIPAIEHAMDEVGYPIFPYISFRNWFDPTSGLKKNAGPPMLSHGYTALRNRPSILIETHMLKPYKPRVLATYEMLRNTLKLLGEQKEDIKKLIHNADSFTASKEIRKKEYPVKFKTDFSDSTRISFKGIHFDIETSDLTGGKWFKYGNEKETMQLKLFGNVVPVNTVMLPEAYIIPPEWLQVIERLKCHGIEILLLAEPSEIEIESYKFSNYKWNSRPYEGRFRMKAESNSINEKRSFPKGSVLVSMDQPMAKVAAYILEPDAEGSLLNWGFFNTIFEQKEYAETYVMEKKAREMMAEDPSLKEEFEIARAENPDKFGSQWAMLNWFYMQSPYWDQLKDVYPVGRIMDPKQIKKLELSKAP